MSNEANLVKVINKKLVASPPLSEVALAQMGLTGSNNLSSVVKTTDKKVTTLRHAFRLLNQRELNTIVKKNKIKIPPSIEKQSEAICYLLKLFQEGNLPLEAYNEFREAAFNPELYTTDGFFLSFNSQLTDITSEKIIQEIERWKANLDKQNIEEESFDADIELLEHNSQRSLFLVTRRNEKFIYDKNSMLSQNYYEVFQICVEIYFDKQIVYFQTSNSVKFSSIKTIVNNFLEHLTEEHKIKPKLIFPKMSNKLNFTFSEEENTVQVYNNISPSTIKLLDLFLEIENSSNFDGFQCVDIKFDHKDATNKELKDRIKSQGYGCDIGDLFNKDEVKNHILSNRIILEIQFKLEYTTYDSDNNPRKHIISAGIINDKSKKALRIFIENNEYSIKTIIKEAYKDLKEVFITHLLDSNLKNEEKIKKMLGI